MIQNVGALQEGMHGSYGTYGEELDEAQYPSYSNLHDTQVGLSVSGKKPVGRRARRITTAVKGSGLDETMRPVKRGWLWYTIPEGQQVLLTERDGRGTILTGPCRVRKWRRNIQILQHYIAYPGEFLIVRARDGSQHHLPGPVEQWLDPRIHAKVEKSESLQISSKEAVVVYYKIEDNSVQRRIVNGPALFIPTPGEWLHTFCWHGSQGDGYKKVPGGLIFQKLWLMPDQMYHDVEDVRTADDVLLTIKLMLFFELCDVEKMLGATHDPIGDFINATSSDVIDLVGRYRFDEFKTHTGLLHKLESYPQLQGRAEQVGYRIHKMVYRGYSTSEALQKMHEQSIEMRTRLKLERETEEQAQALADFKQERQFQRMVQQREQEKQQQQHEIAQNKLRYQQEMEIQQQQQTSKREERRLDQEQQLQYQQQCYEQQTHFLTKLQQLNVDLTNYLTQGRADHVIEMRGGSGENPPHLHLTPRQIVT